MIGYLRGTARDVDLIDVNGVGYTVSTPTALVAGEPAELLVHTVVREDALELYGFATPSERDLFRLLTKVTGVGPRMAVTILRDLGAAGAATALADQDIAALSKVSGIGPKKAASIVAGVTIPPALLTALAGTAATPTHADVELVDALVSLGYDERRAKGALEQVRDQHGAAVDDQRALRLALSALAA